MVATVFGAVAPNAHAGGNSLSPLRERHEAGDIVTFVGYTSSYFADDIERMLAGTAEIPEQRLYRLNGPDTPSTPLGIVGRPLIEATGHPGAYAYRVSLAFRLPPFVPTGEYVVTNFDHWVGDLMDGRFAVGMQSSEAFLGPELAFDDPALGVLADEVRLRAYPIGATVGELRRGLRPPTDAWLRRPVQWPLTVIDLPDNAFVPTSPEPSAIPVVPTTLPVTTAAPTTAAPTTVAPTTIAVEPTPPTAALPADDASDAVAIATIAFVAALLVITVAVVARRRAVATSPAFLAQLPQHDAVNCAENDDPPHSHVANAVASVS